MRDMLPLKCRKSFDLWCYPLDVLPDEAEPFEDIVELWRSRRGDEAIPRRSAFDFGDFMGWHAWMGLSKVDDDGVLCFGFVGEEFKRCFGKGVKSGSRAIDVADEISSEEFERYFIRIMSEPCAGYFTGKLPFANSSFIRVKILDLPLADNAGRPRHVLHLLYIQDRVAQGKHQSMSMAQ